ncbi:MAG: GreA/GreB family elongation factor [Sphingomonas bacterium]|nr:GreA/GreB family elongation factor [Sphingomonas bacterium]
MSVAFRRDSDEEHLEPKFERPIPAGPNRVTTRGRAQIDERIAALNAALANATGDEADAIRRDLRYWHTRQTTAQPTAAPTDGSVGFGSTVDIRLMGRTRTIHIVGDDEADPAQDRIAFTAPLARALMRGEAGDVLAFNGRDEALEIIAVR